ncbi:MAG: AmmeMemoRadiSam system radical SAM enzyme [Deltaproteobacteria bacterium]|jgi:pyruvate formate lyase activating enzyme|nr:AmmeMemoRadiSam system radical SAM enzyme [Deltaproteobacteria bacterium]
MNSETDFKPALFWRAGEKDKETICYLCFRSCKILPGQRGFCQSRLNHDGSLLTLNYGYDRSVSFDPVEKKPLYHFWPGSVTFSIGAPGCNLDCRGCQNSDLSRPGKDWQPHKISKLILDNLFSLAKLSNAQSFSFTYSEPTVFYEYAKDLTELAQKLNMPVIWVTNGHMNPNVLKSLPISAINIDLKGFTEDFYQKIASGRLSVVKKNIETALYLGIWVEITTLLIPGLNDSTESLTETAAYLACLSQDLPWHISRFFPKRFQKDIAPTPVSTLLKAREIGLDQGLKYVYLGNAQGHHFSDTICPKCGQVLAARNGFSLEFNLLSDVDSKCPFCQTPVVGVWGKST